MLLKPIHETTNICFEYKLMFPLDMSALKGWNRCGRLVAFILPYSMKFLHGAEWWPKTHSRTMFKHSQNAVFWILVPSWRIWRVLISQMDSLHYNADLQDGLQTPGFQDLAWIISILVFSCVWNKWSTGDHRAIASMFWNSRQLLFLVDKVSCP